VEFVEGSITDLDLLMETFPGTLPAIPSVPLAGVARRGERL